MDRQNIFTKDFRLLKSIEFKDLYNSKPLISRNILMFFERDTALKNMKIGITASRQVGNSVTRNYLKRLVREFVRKSNIKLLPYRVNILIRPVIAKNFDLNSRQFGANFVKELEFLSKKIAESEITI